MMPGMDGIDLGKEIRKVDKDAKIIYISSSPDFALKSFEARAFYYILKPVDKEQFYSVLDQALESIGYDVLSSINIRTADGSHRVVKGQIMYVELKARKSCYTLVSDTLSSVCLTSSFLSANEELLADRRFFACGASMIVNLSYIRSIDKDGCIKLSSGKSQEITIHIHVRAVASLNSAWMGWCLEV